MVLLPLLASSHLRHDHTHFLHGPGRRRLFVSRPNRCRLHKWASFQSQVEISGVSRVPGRESHSVNGITGVCSVSGVSGVKGCVSRISKLWEKADGVAVFSMASQSRGVSPVHLFVGKKFGDFFVLLVSWRTSSESCHISFKY